MSAGADHLPFGSDGRVRDPDVRALESALDWVVDHLDEFRLEDADGVLQPERMKGVIELGVMACVYATYMDGTRGPRLTRIARFLSEVQADQRVADYVVRSPRHFIVYATLYAALRKLGVEDPARRRLLE